MIRNILTFIIGIEICMVMIIIAQGNFTYDLGWRIGVLILVCALLWLPPKIYYKLMPFDRLDRFMFKYGWWRKFYKLLVGQKEYDETEKLLRRK